MVRGWPCRGGGRQPAIKPHGHRVSLAGGHDTSTFLLRIIGLKETTQEEKDMSTSRGSDRVTEWTASNVQSSYRTCLTYWSQRPLNHVENNDI